MKIRLKFIFTLLLSAACTSEPDRSIEEQMQIVLDEGIKNYQVHGVSATIIFQDNRIWTGVSGYSHDTVTVKPGMLFGIGSITKNIIAVLTLKRAESDSISLEDQLSKWLPSYAYVDGSITIRQLLNHTSGLYMFWDNDKIWKELKSDRSKYWTPQEVLQYIKEPYFEPGNGWHYSNTNYLLLAMIIKKTSASDLSDLLGTYFWKPLGINEVYLSQEEKIPDNQVHVYGDNVYFGALDEDVTFMPRISHESITYGSSGIFISSEDLAKWCHALYSGKLLNQQSMKDMLQFVEFSPVSNMRAYGLGTQFYDKKFTFGEEAIGHGGGNIGSSTYMVFLKKYHVSIVVMINAFPSESIDVITRGLIKIVLKDLNALGIIPYFEFFPTGLLILCISLSVVIFLISVLIK